MSRTRNRLPSETVNMNVRGFKIATSLAYSPETWKLRETVVVQRPGKTGTDLNQTFHDLGIQLSRICQRRCPTSGEDLDFHAEKYKLCLSYYDDVEGKHRTYNIIALPKFDDKGSLCEIKFTHTSKNKQTPLTDIFCDFGEQLTAVISNRDLEAAGK